MTRKLFASPSLADSHALDCARRHSKSGRASLVPFARVLRAAEGTGPAYAVRPCGCGAYCPDYEVVEVSGQALRDLIRAGMLRDAASLEAQADETERECDSGKLPRATERRRRAYVAEGREEAARLRVAAAGLGLVSATLAEPEEQTKRSA